MLLEQAPELVPVPELALVQVPVLELELELVQAPVPVLELALVQARVPHIRQPTDRTARYQR